MELSVEYIWTFGAFIFIWLGLKRPLIIRSGDVCISIARSKSNDLNNNGVTLIVEYKWLQDKNYCFCCHNSVVIYSFFIFALLLLHRNTEIEISKHRCTDLMMIRLVLLDKKSEAHMKDDFIDYLIGSSSNLCHWDATHCNYSALMDMICDTKYI